MRRLVAAGLLPERAGQPVKVVAHISLADLMVLEGSSALQEQWTADVRAAWAARRAAASVSGSDGGAWLDGDAATAVACDVAMTPVVTGEVNPAALEDLVRLCVGLDRLRRHGRGAGAAALALPCRLWIGRGRESARGQRDAASATASQASDGQQSFPTAKAPRVGSVGFWMTWQARLFRERGDLLTRPHYSKNGGVAWPQWGLIMTVPPGPEVRVGRDVLGQLVVGSYNVVVNATDGSSVNVRAIGPPATQRRDRVRSPQLRPGPEPLGRDRELAELTRWLDGGVPAQVCGDRGIGKTTVLRHVVSRRTRTTDVLYLSAAGLAIDDLLQDVFEACYESEGYKPEYAQLRRLMTPVRALIVLDDFEATADDLRVLLDALPACDLLFARTDRCLWAEGETLPLAGLPQEASIVLLGKVLGRPLRQDELPDAIRLWQRTAGRPLAIIQSAAAFTMARSGSPVAREFSGLTGAALARAVAVQLSATAQETLRVLGAVEGVPVPVQLLPQLIGQADTGTALTELTHAGLIEGTAGAVRLTGPFASHIAELYTTPLSAATLTPSLDAWAAVATPHEVADAAPVVTSALDEAVREGNHAAACRLARTAAPRLALSLHWSAWSRVLALGRQPRRKETPPPTKPTSITSNGSCSAVWA